MRKIVFVLFLLSVFLVSCNGYEKSSVNANYVSSLNAEIIKGLQTGATWTKSPEDIASHLFPPLSHDGGPKRYEVTKKVKAANDCLVTVVEEGAIDDEVLGEKRILQFHNDETGWTITDVKLEIKRRH